jgi:hypothetical protein
VEGVDEEIEVVGVATPAGEGSASPDSLARRIARQWSRQQQEAPEEFEEGSVNLPEETQEEDGREEKAAEEEVVEEDEETDDDESTLSPPPLKPVREPSSILLPLYTHKAPFDKPLHSSRPRRDQVIVTNSKKQKKNTASLDIDDINTQALMD